ACPAPAGAGEPNLSTESGRVFLTWLQREGEQTTFAYSTYEHGSWSAPRTIASGPSLLANWANFPSFVPMPGGACAANWLDRHGGDKFASDVRVAMSKDGVTWSAPWTPHRDATTAEHGFVSMVADDRGGGTCVWLDGREFDGKE